MVCLRFLPVVDVNLCRWWVWVCADLWFGFVLFCFFFFFFEAALADVGLCWWWMWVCADLSGCVFFFLGGVGGCGFVSVVAVDVCAGGGRW